MSRPSRPIAHAIAFAATFALITALLGGCSSTIRRVVMKTVEPYFHVPGTEGAAFDRVTERVYSFRWKWYRNLVVVTDVGLVVLDPMNASMAKALRAELDARFPGVPVDTLIYSHYHLDHTRGGAELAPAHVVAHEKCPTYWQAVPHDGVVSRRATCRATPR